MKMYENCNNIFITVMCLSYQELSDKLQHPGPPKQPDADISKDIKKKKKWKDKDRDKDDIQSESTTTTDVV